MCSFSQLLEDLEASKQAFGVKGYGLSETTLEEVFLAVNSKGKGPPSLDEAASEHLSVAVAEAADASTPLLQNDVGNGVLRESHSFDGDLRRPMRLTVPPHNMLASSFSCFECFEAHSNLATWLLRCLHQNRRMSIVIS